MTERYAHSLSTYKMGPHCVWLVIVGGAVNIDDTFVVNPNITMLIELGKQVIIHTQTTLSSCEKCIINVIVLQCITFYIVGGDV